MKSVQELINIADEYNKKVEEARQKNLQKAIEKNIKFLENAIEKKALRGYYEASSDNLCAPCYWGDSGYTMSEMRGLLKKALIEHFTKLGFSYYGESGNYLTITWEKKKRKG